MAEWQVNKVKLIVTALLIAAPLEAQDLSTTPMRVERRQVETTFSLTVTTPPLSSQLPHRRGTNVFAIQDPESIASFVDCWNQKDNLKWHIQCGKVQGAAGMRGAPTRKFDEELGDEEVYVFQETSRATRGREFRLLSILTATMVVVSNDYCVGAFLITNDKAHGTITLHPKPVCLQRSQSEVDADNAKVYEKEKEQRKSIEDYLEKRRQAQADHAAMRDKQ